MHERLGDTTHEEANKDIPDEMKHYFLLSTPDSGKITRSNTRTAGQRLLKISNGALFARMVSEHELEYE
jgi:hypothetical protein